MLTSRKRTVLVALLLLACAAVAQGLGRPGPALASRPAQVTRALDYLHAQQGADGRFQDVAYTPWAIIAIAAAGEDPSGTAWTASGGSPMDYLQRLDLDAHANSGTVGNAPCYYAKMILAYVAAGHGGSVTSAGSKKVDLVARLLAHRRADGRFCPSASSDYVGAVNATTWAIIALEAAGAAAPERAAAVAWLKDEQLSDGGFSSMAKDGPGTPVSDVDDTAAAIEALVAGGVARSSGVITAARAYLRSAQRSDGGFSSARSGGYTYSESTAWAIQAILALGESPSEAAWTQNGHTPREALRALQKSSGVLCHRQGVTSSAMLSTTQSLVALAERTFSTWPRGDGSWTTPFASSPRVSKLTPENGATLRSTTVTVHAAYSDGSGGTGIAASAVRLTVDGHDMTSKASVTGSFLQVKLTGASVGAHTIKLTVRDRAGNTRSIAHTVTVASGSGGTSAGTGETAGTATAASSTAANTTSAETGEGDSFAATADSSTVEAGGGEMSDAAAAEQTADVPEAAFPSASLSSARAPAAATPAAGNATGGSPAGDSPPAGTTTGAGTDGAGSESGHEALAYLSLALLPAAAGFWIAWRGHWRRWKLIGESPQPNRRGDGPR